VHTLALQLAPVLAAEKSRVPFYIAGGALVAWALIVSLGLGLRRPEFPGGQAGERIVITITAVLVLAAVSMAVITAGSPAKAGASGAAQSNSAAPTGGSGTSLRLAANPGGLISYDVKQLSAKAGAVTITMANASPVEHDVAVEQGGKTLGATSPFTGGSRTLTLNLKPGTYTFFCTVPGHRRLGMEGTIKVS
jgi:plastocyanin